MSEHVPAGWACEPVKSAFRCFGGSTPSKHNPAFWGDGIPWLSSGDIKSDRIEASSETITPAAVAGGRSELCRQGAVVVVVRSGILKHTLPIGILGIRAAINQDIKCFDSGDDLLNEWLALALRANTVEILKLNREGTTVQSVKTETLTGMNLPIPPLAEQVRIVAKVEALLGRVNAARARLARVPAILKRFRQSVLAAACSGQLTADWREHQTDVEPAQINGDDFSLGDALDGLPDLPQAWGWVALGNYARCFRGKFTPRPRNDPRYFGGNHPFIQIGSLPREGGFITSHTQTLNDEGLAVSRKFPKGTVVIAIVGATIGNCGVLAYDMCVTDSLVGIETGTKEGNRFVEFFLRHKRYEIREASYASGGQPNIKLEFLNPYPFALPPLNEQREIVRRVDALFALADKIEARVQAATLRVQKITQAILAKAFRGELVPTEAELAKAEGRDYEPASALLERIKAERETNSPKRAPRRRSKQSV